MSAGRPVPVIVRFPMRPGPAVRDMVDRIIRVSATPEPRTERRVTIRYPFPQLFQLTPVDRNGSTIIGPPTCVVGKDISQDGLGFFHQGTLPYRYAVAEFDEGRDEPARLLMNLIWCRFVRDGWYDSGGRFVRLVGEVPGD